MVCATSSFPVPISPSMRTVELVEATCSTCSRTDSRAALLPMIRSNRHSAWSLVGCVKVASSATGYSFPGNAYDCYNRLAHISTFTDVGRAVSELGDSFDSRGAKG